MESYINISAFQGPGARSYLRVVEHAQVRVHLQGQVFMATPLVQLCCLLEFSLVGINICQEQVVVVLSMLFPVLFQKKKKKKENKLKRDAENILDGQDLGEK